MSPNFSEVFPWLENIGNEIVKCLTEDVDNSIDVNNGYIDIAGNTYVLSVIDDKERIKKFDAQIDRSLEVVKRYGKEQSIPFWLNYKQGQTQENLVYGTYLNCRYKEKAFPFWIGGYYATRDKLTIEISGEAIRGFIGKSKVPSGFSLCGKKYDAQSSEQVLWIECDILATALLHKLCEMLQELFQKKAN
jgi:hypothetical protein